jgi:hypothetical protein
MVLADDETEVEDEVEKEEEIIIVKEEKEEVKKEPIKDGPSANKTKESIKPDVNP